VKDALSALQKGLLAHPGYVAAQVALGRVYLEARQTTDAIATFTKVLTADPGNLVAARSLADIHLGRGDKLESLKKYKLYRALSGDRKVDGIIAELEPQVEPKPVTPLRKWVTPAEPLPPPPSFQDTDKGKKHRPLPKMPGGSAPLLDEPFDITPLSFEPGEDSGKSALQEGPFLVPTRDVAIAHSPVASPATPPPVTETAKAPEPAAPELAAVTRVIAMGEAVAAPASPTEPPEPAPAPSEPLEPAVALSPAASPLDVPPAAPAVEAAAPPEAVLAESASAAPVPRPFEEEPAQAAASAPTEPAEASGPTGRALADLYYAQGHYAEALQIYDDLVNRNPFDEELQRMRRDAEARLLPAGVSPASVAPDPAFEKRMARIRALKQWLSQVQAG
jgi:tetratricopeptide (TPR) repeat protein